MLKILLIEPYYTGSHKKWANDYRRLSNHNVKILSLKGQFWKWRMHGGAVTLADKFNKINWKPNLIIATDMLDFTTFLSLTLPEGDYCDDGDNSARPYRCETPTTATRGTNYIAAGQASVRKNLKARAALSDNKTDFGALGQEASRAV